MEEHLLLRVPVEVKERLEQYISSNAANKAEEVYYEKESGRNYIFVIGALVYLNFCNSSLMVLDRERQILCSVEGPPDTSGNT